ncbi:hypothetical protein ABWK46_16135 [Peribacillus frigoritolerans]|uniref:hypothetical protein n=1 Tax=Peribacillus frigoritolerans TaxID=450367 RepID=UPI003393AAA0
MKGPEDYEDLKEFLVPLEFPVPLEFLDLKDLKVSKEYKGFQDHLDQLSQQITP